MLRCIFAQLVNGVIGIDNDLPWMGERFKKLRCFDLNFFKEVTFGKDLVMGSKTWESLDYTPLPGRGKHFILTNQDIATDFSNQIVWLSLDNFKSYYKNNLEKDFVLIGGSQIYNHLLPDCDIVYRSIYKLTDDNFCKQIESDPTAISINNSLLKLLQNKKNYTKKILSKFKDIEGELTISSYTKIKHQ